MFKIEKPGFCFDVSAADYFADPCPQPSLTQSLVKVLLNQSPLHAMHKHPRLAAVVEGEDEPVEKYVAAQAIGNAAHALLIGRGKELAVGAFDNWKTKVSQAFRADAESDGKTAILEKHMDAARQMVEAVRAQLATAGWIDAFHKGKGEVVACWEEDGIWLRTMIDWLTPDGRALYDLKSTAASFAPHIINRKMVDDGWDVQAAMHERAMNALDPAGAGRRKFRFVALENYAPFAMVPVELSETWLTLGRKKLDMAIGIWREAMKAGRFDGYPLRAFCPDYPGYAESQWLEREVQHSDAKPERSGEYLRAG